ncbi:hypothetical protein MMC25_001050 [Agyrium rufum]|nr:hypothetical protein [Agyrium rufum]
MPRPKRAKITPTVPKTLPFSARQQGTAAPAAEQNALSSFGDVRQQNENGLAKIVFGDRASSRILSSNSDDSDGLVKRNATGKNRWGVAKKNVYLGLVPLTDTAGAADDREDEEATTAKQSGKPQEREDTRPVASEEQHKSHRAGRGTSYENDEQVSGSGSFAQEQGVVPSSMPEADDLAVAGRDLEQGSDESLPHFKDLASDSSRARPQMTPNRHDSSILALVNFKRRPRQPSILQIQQLGQDEESTLLGESALGVEDDDEEAEDFAPDDESTPLRFINATLIVQHGAETPAKEGNTVAAHHSSGSRKRKLRTPEVQVPQSQQDVDSRTRTDDLPASEPDAIGVSEVNKVVEPNEEDQIEEVELPAIRMPHVPPPSETYSDTMAPPASSGSPAPPTHSPSRSSKNAPLSSRGKQQRRGNASKAVRNPPKATKAVSTAALQNLLPRRHPIRSHRARGAFYIPSSDVEPDDQNVADEDADELSLYARRLSRRRPLQEKTAKANSRTIASTGKAKKTVVKSKATNQQPASGRTSKAATSKPAAKPSARTYDRSRRLSDKENTLTSTNIESGDIEGYDRPRASSSTPFSSPPSTSLLELEQAGDKKAQPSRDPTREIRKLVKKFREVDEWKLDFEVITASSSSPADAR